MPDSRESLDASVSPEEHGDEFLWLEEVLGDDALTWVRARNAESEQLLTSRPDYEPTRQRLRALLDSKARIPQVSRRGADALYNLWQDGQHPRGLWRRTTLAGYRKPEPPWETVLDLDALAAAEGENWVWGGAAGLAPGHRLCLLHLSRGGADAVVVREFDTVTKAFVDGGFELPEAKSRIDWLDEDTVYVGTDFGPGSMTDSGYPRVVKRWRRGTPLSEAQTVFEGETSDVSVGVSVDATPGHRRIHFSRSLDFYRQQRFIDQGTSGLQALDVPADATVAFWNSAGDCADTLLLELRSDWPVAGVTWPSGSLLASDAARYLAGERRFHALFTPTPTRSLAGFTTTREHCIVNTLDDVASRLEQWRRTDGGSFERQDIAAPFPGTLGISALHDPMRSNDALAEHWLMVSTDFLSPDALWLGSTADPRGTQRERLKALPELFDADGMRATQHFATSADGCRVPYFVVWPKGVDATTRLEGGSPTLLYGYGGFEIALQPRYSALQGSAWIERGGVYVVANIRGGGEYGPGWHQAAVKEHKQRSYDDFIAVAEDLIGRGITTPPRLGIQGGSNGGLLVGAAFTQRPELFNAVICSVPLLDMRRYHRLLAGASWMAEYGDPDQAAQWAWISRYSPYQRVRPGTHYPRVLFTTSTRDDRVHPGHARKMAARMLSHGHPVLYYENIEGGHGGAADNAQRAHVLALEMSYLWLQLGG